jgi:pimeloyl-ACP methyl ester carboxylesterase
MVTSEARFRRLQTVRRRAAAIAILNLAFILGGCASGPAPNLSRLYEAHTTDRVRVPVIIIPGILGSRLVDSATGKEAWPGSTRQLLTSDYRQLALRIDPETLEPLDDGLVAHQLFSGAVGRDFYGRIVDALEKIGGYRRARLGEPAAPGEARMYPFAYDWRQDNVVTVRALDAFIEQIRRDYGDPALRVDVIAHSMGGLIVRYYERYGTNDVLDGNVFPVTGGGAAKLRRIVLLGTPNQGSVTAIHSFLNGYQVGLSRLPTEGIATMPSMYQLFPHPLVTWITTTRGTPLERDLFDVNVWRRFEWSVFDRNVRRRMTREPGVWPSREIFERYFEKRLERGRRFVWSLIVPTGEVELVEPLVFGGDCIPTPARLVVEEVNGDSVARLRPEQILRPVPRVDYDALMYEPGDGSVTKSSLLGRQELDPSIPRHENANLEFERAFFVCEDHEALTGNVNFLDNLLHHLLSAD